MSGSFDLEERRRFKRTMSAPKDMKLLKEAAKAIEDARSKLRTIEGWSSVEVIRNWRDRHANTLFKQKKRLA